jgi:AraC-like DNA-binding protein
MFMMRAAVLAHYPAVARQLGLDPVAMLREVGIASGLMDKPDGLLPGDAVVRLLQNSAVRSGCATVGLRMAELRRLSDFGVTSLLLSQQRTVRDALRMAIQYLHLMNESLVLHLEETADTAILSEEVLINAPIPITQTVEIAMAANVQLCRSILGDNWRPRRVFFRHSAPGSLELHRRVFGCPCEFDSDLNGMSCPLADLDRVNPAADPQMARFAQNFLEMLPRREKGTVCADARRLIYLYLPLGRATLKQVAQGLGLSVRTLQRNLGAAGESFDSLLNAVREELVPVYLDNPHFGLGHVATLLGYSHHSSFTRWFTQRFGVAPDAWRKRRARDSSDSR